MGPFERLFLIMGGIAATLPAAPNHVELHVPGKRPIIDTMADAAAVGGRLLEAARDFPEEEVARAVTHVRADAGFMERFRATGPEDEERDLRDVVRALLTLQALADERGKGGG